MKPLVMRLLATFRAHVRSLWPNHPLHPVLPILPFALYVLVAALRDDLRIELVGATLLVAVLAWVGPKTKAALTAMYPIGLVGMLYDGMRPLQRWGLTAERVHVCDVRAIEARLFGFHSGGASMTLHDWFFVHHSPMVDFVCAFPYATFILVSFACATFLAFRDRMAMRRFTWAFFLMNVAGFATYHLVPTAPPWYFHTHGCAVDLATRASEGPALARVDRMLGISYFHAMYAKASSVFGAIPSLHCAYPMLVAIEGWRSFGPRLRALSFGYWALMVFSAVYLDHHWLIDGLMGSLYAILAAVVLRRVIPSARAERNDRPAAAFGTAEAE